ncbi:MAG: sulfotransferase domain-containing protein [Gammaproteobacteria bacterium]|nr:sulfotransferase domain-containing protein [Gammaproteobacteria bacterium]
MIVLSAGMQKSGTGWYFNLTNELLVAAGHQDVRQVKQRYRLESVLRHYNCNIDEPTPAKLARIAIPHLLGYSFVVKSHSRPTPFLRLLISGGVMRPTYIYRDPRDVALSAFEHGQQMRSQGEHHSFARLETVKAAVRYAADLLEAWDQWMQCRRVLKVRYEDLLADPIGELQRLAGFLSLALPTRDMERIVAKYSMEGDNGDQPEGLHFNQGEVGRFRQVFSSEELAVCQAYLGSHPQKMGYAE